MKVEVLPPEIDGDTVVFRWRQSAPNPYQHVDEFFFRYEGIDLSVYAPELFYEIFLALQIRVFATYPEPVEVVFPTPVPRWSAEFWLAFHETDSVSVAPLTETGGYSPWAAVAPLHPEPRAVAVFFGGGKDSTLAASLLSEIYGRDQVLLVQFVGPMRDEPKLWRLVEERQENLMLRPARERLGYATQRVWTDFQARFRPEAYRHRPHLELYTVGALPALLARGVSLCTFSIVRGTYRCKRTPKGRLVYSYAKSRPEMTATQSRHYQRALGVDLTVTDVVFPFSSQINFQILARRYPEAQRQIVSCTHGAVNERWCYACSKCAMFALNSLFAGAINPDFDYDRYFRESPFVASLVAYAASEPERNGLGVAPWQPFLCNQGSYLSICHLLATLDLDALPIAWSPAARANLALLKRLWGTRTFPEQLTVWRPSLRLLGPPLGPAVEAIARDYFPIVDELPERLFAGNAPALYVLDGKMPTRTALLDHIRERPDDEGSDDVRV